MKIALFANTDWFIHNFNLPLARALRRAGHDVLIVTPAGTYAQNLQLEGFRWIPAPMQRKSLNPFRELLFLAWLTLMLKRERVDLLHSFTLKAVVYGSIAAKLARVPARVNAVTGLGYVFTSTDRKARLLRPVVRLLLRLALKGRGTRLLVLNADDRAFFIDGGVVKPEVVATIPGSGVDCEAFRPEVQDVREGPVRVLLPSRLLRDKGVAEFVDAARRLRETNSYAEFQLAGVPDDGNPASIPASTVQDWVSEGTVSWLGHVHDMQSLLRRTDIVVLPSYREGLPTCLTEAAATGLPLVTTDAPGCREVVQHGVNGFIVPCKNGEALAQAIACLIGDPALRQKFGLASRNRAVTEFSQEVVIKRTLSIYSALLSHQTDGVAGASGT